jgi:hypothetical protein
MSIQPSEHGILENSQIVQEYKDKFVEYKIKMAKYNNKEYYASSILVNGFGIYSGFGSSVSIHCKSSLDKEVHFVKTFFSRELSNSENGMKHISKLPIFQTTQQLSLFH